MVTAGLVIPQKSANDIYYGFFFFFLQRAGLSAHFVTIHNSLDIEVTRCPSTEEWMKKMWYIYTMEYYSAIKRLK